MKLRPTAALLLGLVLAFSAPAGGNHPTAPDGYRAKVQLRREGSETRQLAPREGRIRLGRIVRRVAKRVRATGHAVRIVVVVSRQRTPTWFAGEASFYDEPQGTACGGPFDPDKLTTAHRSLACGTRLVVSRGRREVTVVVNDRGPYVEGRVLDLSRAAFERLGPTSAGVLQVKARRP